MQDHELHDILIKLGFSLIDNSTEIYEHKNLGKDCQINSNFIKDIDQLACVIFRAGWNYGEESMKKKVIDNMFRGSL